jgi:hypothetical protein
MFYYDGEKAKIGDLLGKKLTKITVDGDERIEFITSNNEHYLMYHIQDCCEGVYIESIAGDINKLVGKEILLAEEISNDKFIENWKSKLEYEPDSYTWTFYKLSTINGNVTIRWLGESNGYYSESVDFVLLPN